MKPKNRFSEGLFVEARGLLEPGAQLARGLVRDSEGQARPSDDMLGTGMTLIGFGIDPSSKLSTSAATAWTQAGGSIAQLCHRGQASPFAEGF